MNLRRFWIFTMLLLTISTVHGLAQEGYTERGELTLPRIVAQSGEKTDLVVELRSGSKARFQVSCPSEGRGTWIRRESFSVGIVVSGAENAATLTIIDWSSRFPQKVQCTLKKGELLVDQYLKTSPEGEWDGTKDGAIHKLMETVRIFDYEFAPDPKDPLTFEMTRKGYQYLSGSGRVIDTRTFNTYQLPFPGRKAGKKDAVGTGEKSEKRARVPATETQPLQTALKDPDPETRYKAVQTLTDQKLLAQVAETDPDRHVRWAAVDNLKDQPALARVAVNDPDQLVRLRAVHRLTDLELLRAVAKKSSDEKVAQQAREKADKLEVERKAPPAKVKTAEDALKSVDPDVRYKAVEKLTDEKLLAQIAKNDPSRKIRLVAVDRISTDQATLAYVALNDPDEMLRLRAVHRLNDPMLLLEVASYSLDNRVTQKAREKAKELKSSLIQGTPDKESTTRRGKRKLPEVGLSDPDPDARFKAVQKLADQSVLAQIAENDSNHIVRWAAVDKLKDQRALAEVAMTDPNDSVRLRAVHRLTDQEALKKVVLNASDRGVVKQALEKIEGSDPEALKQELLERRIRNRSRTLALSQPPGDLFQKLKEWRPNSRSLSIKLSINLSASSGEKGNDVKASFSTNKECYLRLFTTWKGAKQIVQLFPNRWHVSSKIRGGQEYTVPAENAGLRMTLGSPHKDGIIFALASTKPVLALERGKTVRMFVAGAFKVFVYPGLLLRRVLHQVKTRPDWGYAELTGLPRPDNIVTTQTKHTTNAGDGRLQSAGKP